MNESQQHDVLRLIPEFIKNHRDFNKEFDSWINDISIIDLTLDDIESGIMGLNGWRDRRKEKGDNPKLTPLHYTKAIRKCFRTRTNTPDINEVINNTLRRM